VRDARDPQSLFKARPGRAIILVNPRLSRWTNYGNGPAKIKRIVVVCREDRGRHGTTRCE
jgi:hypothetical protein